MENYSRFYSALNRLPWSGDRDELKAEVVKQYSFGRTTHVSELTEEEYNDCCVGMEKMLPPDEEDKRRAALVAERKRCRSAALHQIQLYGIDTTDWGKVNEFCRQGRIAGKEFRELDCEELRRLTKKMRAINKKKEGQPCA